MLSALFLGGALALGQPPVPPGFPSPPYPQLPTPAIPETAPTGPLPTIPGANPGSVVPAYRTDAPPMPLGTSVNQVPTSSTGNESSAKDNSEGFAPWLKPRSDEGGGFYKRLYREYYKQFFPDPKATSEEEPEPPRRALPSPWSSPPFPGSEFQGYPLLGVPASTTDYPFMKALYSGPYGEQIKDTGIKFSGWATMFGDWSTAKNTNAPTSYWINPNRVGLDQLVFKLERLPDTVQTDHIDWGFRSIALYGQDYRYTTAGGWGSDQLLKHNQLDGWDPVEQYANVYIPGFLGGTDIRVGRWIACPDIETQYAPDNYMGSHSLLFTFDTYTNTGIMVTQKINDQLMVQGVLHAGTDMAPWYPGAVATGAFGVRWVTKDNNDAFYTWLNAINSAEFRHFTQYGQPLGHDNFNYVVTTWEHKFSDSIHTKTEAYYMWQRDAEVGGTPSAGPVQPFGGGGGDGVLLPGLSQTYGILNYTMFGLTKQDYLTVRNEWYRDERGMRTGYAGTYTSHALGLSHQFNDVLMLRPEIGYYRNWHEAAFDGGTKRGVCIYGFDLTYRF
jgi:Putative beta-barrel porin-2, OmpL-like. bbp2